jgi:hypothetical protein
VGSALVRQLIGHADGIFHVVRLRTGTQVAADFYVGLGFHAVQDEAATHIFSLRRIVAPRQVEADVGDVKLIEPGP